ncbi:hypothetical protein KPE71_14095 [Acinetobacter soli]|uniref:hypothetical protein n=1 Tax=Acinetobacter soli TaxID=487316 RepID=UPI001C0DA8B5|nr:hypothetical protein [Acinetobacter soli]MBU3121384.1 hypothetical protein [Acinetobacter soli]
MNHNPKMIEVGQKVKFDNENIWFTVKAVRHPFVICWCKLFGKGYYTILDVENNIRGPGTSWGLGHETDEQIAESMLALHGDHPDEIEQEISRRNQVPLIIKEIRERSRFEILKDHIDQAYTVGKDASESVDDHKGSCNADRIIIDDLPRVHLETLNKNGISCIKHPTFTGAFILTMTFGQADANYAGLKAAKAYLDSKNVSCSMHREVD